MRTLTNSLFTLLFVFVLSICTTHAAVISSSQKVDSLLRSAAQHIDSNPQKARQYINEALTFAEGADLQRSVANALNYLGITYYNEQQYEEAIQQFQKSLKVFFRLGDKDKIANMMKKIGLSYLNQKKYSKAIEYYEFAQRIFEQEKYIDYKAETHVELGVIYRLSNRYSNALKEFEEALQLFQQLDNKTGQAETLHHMGVTAHEMGNLVKAQEFFGESISIYENYLDYSGLSAVLNDYGRTLIDLKEYEKAKKVLEQAKEKIQIDNPHLLGRILSNYGAVLIYKSEFQEAEQYLHQAMEIADSVQAKELQAQVYRTMYELYFRNNDTRSALAYYQKYIAVRDTTANVVFKGQTSPDDDLHLSNLIIFITVFGFIIIIGLVIWLVNIIKQRDKAHEELRKLKETKS
ncbi:MAG: tetratricopeptide repeat protein [Salinivirgaceae bacterium]|jgi:tetratricopeptide (TPR) repeat protein|nr:tetratricopeptide repeat protein [Salinivirgaceae bacterium]